MATLNNFCLMVVLMSSVTLLVRTGLSFEISEPSEGPITEGSVAPEPEPLYLSDCTAKTHPQCGKQIFFGIFFGNEIVSRSCCSNLIHNVGEACHNSMTKYTLRSPEFKEKETQVLQRSKQIWIDCYTSFHLDVL